MAEHLFLFELNQKIKHSLNATFNEPVWIVAEISEIRTVRSGHCYLELVEKEEGTEQIRAKVRATIWAFSYRMLKPYFETSTGQELRSGLKILLRASVEFQEVYGLSLNIKDIDPSFTLGDIARKRMEVIRQLQEEGVMDMNKEVVLASIPQKIAIISSPTAAGYEDFVNQLENNGFGFKVYHKLFNAIMQGSGAEASIISALEKVYAYEDFFDAVVLIRGGGSTADLMCFDSYLLALNIAQFPLPVLTGIGHERDESVADMVANKRLKTPTAVAEFIINQMATFEAYLDDLKQQLVEEVRMQTRNNRHRLELAIHSLKPLVYNVISNKRRQPREAAQRLKFGMKTYFDNQSAHFAHVRESARYLVKRQVRSGQQQCAFHQARLKLEVGAYFNARYQKIALSEKTLKLSDPKNILDKGYSITYFDGKPVKSANLLTSGGVIKTQLSNGQVVSQIIKIS